MLVGARCPGSGAVDACLDILRELGGSGKPKHLYPDILLVFWIWPVISAVISGLRIQTGETLKRFYGPRRRVVRGRRLEHYYVLEYDTETRRRRWLSTHQSTIKLARHWVDAQRLDAVLHPQLRRLAPVIWSAATEEWLQDQSHLRPDSLATLRTHVRLWHRQLGCIALHQLTQADVDRYLATRAHLSPRTYNASIAFLRWFINWARRKQYVTLDKLSFQPRKLKAQNPTVLTPEAETQVLTIASGPLHVLITVAIDTGLRRRALLSLTWGMVDFEGWLILPGEILKSGRALRLPLTDRALSALRKIRQLQGPVFPFSTSTLSRQWARALKRAGLPHMKFHSLRKTFVTRLRQRGVPVEITMRLSDHSDAQTMLHVYREIDDSELVKWIQVVGVRDLEASK